MHAPEVERIGKGKVHKPYEFGAKPLLGRPYDCHAVEAVISEIESGTASMELCRPRFKADQIAYHPRLTYRLCQTQIQEPGL